MVVAAIRLKEVLTLLSLKKIRLIFSITEDTLGKSITLSSFELIDNKGLIPTSLPNNTHMLSLLAMITEIQHSTAQPYLLYLVHKEKEITIRQLSLKSGISYPYVRENVNKLRLLDLITITVYPKDKTNSQNCSINKECIEILTK